MRKTFLKIGLASAALLLMSTEAYAQATANATLNVTAIVGSRARLTLGAAGITFPDSDPIATPSVPGGTVTVDVGARTAPASTVQLTLQATGDLASGAITIPINTVTWTAAGAGFVAGAGATTAQNVGSWTGSGLQSGSQSFFFANSWSYQPGTYTTTLNYTLSVP